MDFISSAIFMIIIAIIVGIKTNSYNISEFVGEERLYDEETLEIMKRYELITEDQYKDMKNEVKEKV